MTFDSAAQTRLVQDSFDFGADTQPADLPVLAPEPELVEATVAPARSDRRASRFVPCRPEFVEAVTNLCRRSDQTPSRLIAAALLLWDAAGRPLLPDPGPPTLRVRPIARDPAKRPRARWPGLHLRLPGDLSPADARAVLGYALSLANSGPLRLVAAAEMERTRATLAETEKERDRILGAFERLAFPIPEHPVRMPGEAARLLGFANEFGLDTERVNARFRELSFIYHPDLGVPDKGWFKHLAEAREVLLRALRR